MWYRRLWQVIHSRICPDPGEPGLFGCFLQAGVPATFVVNLVGIGFDQDTARSLNLGS